jgi:hypothetical protein
LTFPDLPGVLWLQAGVAALIGDVPAAVRITDAVLPALSVIPLAILARTGRPQWMIPLALLAVVLHPVQLFFFTGDFIKNEATVPLIFVLGLLLSRWSPGHRWAFSAAIAGTLGLIALCHFGALLVSLTITVLWVIAKLGRRSLKFWLIATAGVVAGFGLVLLFLSFTVQSRFERLIAVVGNPSTLVRYPFWQTVADNYYRPAVLFAVISGQIFSLALALLAWRARKELSPTVRAAMIAFLTTALLSSSPFIGAAWADRLIALSFVPLWLAAILLWASIPRNSIRYSLLTLTGATLLASAVIAPLGPTPAVLTDKQWHDLKALSQAVELQKPSLVVATHGTDYLAAWQLRTDVSDDQFFNFALESGPYQGVYRIDRKPSTQSGPVIYSNESFNLVRLK